MGKIKISEMSSASSLSTSDIMTVVQDGQNKKASISMLVNLFPFLVSETEISSAQLLNIHNTSISILSAPGTGYYNQPVHIQYIYTHGGVSYTATDSMLLAAVYGDQSNRLLHTGTNSLLTQSASTVSSYAPGFVVYPASAIENTAIFLKRTGQGQLQSGNGTLLVRVIYQTIQL